MLNTPRSASRRTTCAIDPLVDVDRQVSEAHRDVVRTLPRPRHHRGEHGDRIGETVRNGILFGCRATAEDRKHRLANGSDDVFPPFSNNAEPTFEPFLIRQNVLYYAGLGGTVYQRLKPDVANVWTTQLAFYGIANYRKTPGAYVKAIQINMPITGDNAGNIYFGFRANGSTPLGLKGGLARIDANGNGTWISAADASGDKKMTGVQTNCAPAISRDGKTVVLERA